MTVSPTTRQIWLLSLGFILAGALSIASSYGLLPEPHYTALRMRTMYPTPPWVKTGAGCVLLFVGLATLLNHYHYRIAAIIAGIIAGAGIVTVLLWLPFVK